MQPTIPIIIINWNGFKDTVECLDSLWKMSHTGFDIYLVDNGSDEEEVRQLRALCRDHETVNLILNEHNTGFAKANNQVMDMLLKTGKYRYIALLNNDAAVDQDWLKNLVECAEEHSADMVSSLLVNYYNRDLLDNAGHFMLNTGEIMPLGYNRPVGTFQSVQVNEGACAGACLYSVKMLERIGLFDTYFHTGYEDAEYGLRALLTGHKLLLNPKAIAYHKMSASINKIRDVKYMVKIQQSIFYTYLKLMPWPVMLLHVVFIVFRTLIVLLLFLIFLRMRYLRIYFTAFKNLILRDLPVIKKNRNAFYGQNELIPLAKIIGRQQFFLWDNIQRFYRYFLKGERTIFEK